MKKPIKPIMTEKEIPDWKINVHDFEHNGCLIAEVDETKSQLDILAAFVEDECRGLVKPLRAPNGKLIYFLMVYSNEQAGEVISFKHYDRKLNKITALDTKLDWIADMIGGTVQDPLVL